MQQKSVRFKAFSTFFAISSGISSALVPDSVQAEGFIDNSTLGGGVYYWQRHRERKDLQPGSDKYGQYTANLHHSTINANLDFSSGFAGDWIGLDLAAFTALELSNTGPAAPNEIGFSDGDSRWDEPWSGDKNGVSLYKAALKMKYDDYWLRAGYLQPSGQTLMSPHWSLLPGTYRGVEAGTVNHFSDRGDLAVSYMWSDKYKAPWYQHMYEFRKADGKTRLDYLHSLGFKFSSKNKWQLEAALGQADNYMDQFFTKASSAIPVMGNDLETSWQFYGARDHETGGASNVNDVYSGLAWLQAMTFGYHTGPFKFRLEGTWVKAEGNQGYFLQRMTPSYASSNGRLDVWWDSRSDWNANGEKAVFAGVMMELDGLSLPGWEVGTSGAWGWDAKPSSNPAFDQNQRLRESAWNLDLLYTLQQGWGKGTQFKLHYTRYNNHSTIPSYQGGYGNIFQDEKDVKFIVSAPFTFF